MSKISQYVSGAPLVAADEWPFIRSGANRKIAAKDSLIYHTRRNLLDNALFNVAQRGTTIALTNASAITLDRWAAMQATSAAGSVTQQASGANARLKKVRVGRTAAAANTGVISFAQALETQDAIILAGQPVCFAFEGLAGANFSAASGNLNVVVAYGTGTDQSSASLLAGTWTGYTALTLNAAVAALTTTSAPFVFTGTVPANATQLGVIVSYTPVGTAGADDNFYLLNAWFGYGDTPPPIWNNDGPALELARCQRHLPVFQAINGVGGDAGGGGACIATTSAVLGYEFKTRARKPTTGITVNASGSFFVRDSAGNPVALTALVHRIGAQDSHEMTATVAAGLVAGNATRWGTNNATNGQILFTGAEL